MLWGDIVDDVRWVLGTVPVRVLTDCAPYTLDSHAGELVVLCSASHLTCHGPHGKSLSAWALGVPCPRCVFPAKMRITSLCSIPGRRWHLLLSSFTSLCLDEILLSKLGRQGRVSRCAYAGRS
jgi:hypothetical protein